MSSEQEIMITPEEDTFTEEQPQQTSSAIMLPVSSACAKAQTLLHYIYVTEDDDSRQDLYELIQQFAAQPQQPGDANDFHNFSVVLAQRNEYVYACTVLDCGLRLFPKNVDLLADYLQYGTRCNQLDACKKYYKTLLKIPRRRWTWRGFAFLMEYLLFLMDRSDSAKELDAKEQELVSIATDFRKQFPYTEEPYRSESNVYRMLNLPDQEAAVLRLALENVRIAPKCALRYADILFERGLYSEAAAAVQRAIHDANQTQASVNEGYVYYLNALCKIALAQQAETDLHLDEEAVRSIYSDFNIALAKFQKTQSSYTEVIRTKTNTLVNKTGIAVDPSYELLYECVSE